MDDELRLLQEKLHRVAERLSNFAPTKQKKPCVWNIANC